MKRINKKGQEIMDPTPVAMPVGFHHPPSLQERIMRAIKREMSDLAQSKGEESFEEADDFEVGDDFDPHSPYETHFDHDANIKALNAAVKAPKKTKAPTTLPDEEPLKKPTEASNA